MKGVSSLEDAAEAVGKADVAKAEEIVQMARVDTCAHTCLEPQLLKEWLETFLHQQQATLTLALARTLILTLTPAAPAAGRAAAAEALSWLPGEQRADERLGWGEG